MENFIPPVETEKVTSRAVYNEEDEDWKLKPYQAPSARWAVVYSQGVFFTEALAEFLHGNVKSTKSRVFLY